MGDGGTGPSKCVMMIVTAMVVVNVLINSAAFHSFVIRLQTSVE